MSAPLDKLLMKKQQAVQLLQGGQPAVARELLEKICGKRPRDAEAWLYLGACYEAEGKLQQALECFRKAVTLQPTLFQAQLSLGNLYKQQQSYEQAIACYTRAHELQPRNPGVIGNMGNTWLLAGDFRQAADCYHRVLKLAPDTPAARHGLGMALLGQGQVEDAVSCFTELLGKHPDWFAAWLKLGEIHAGQGNFAAALHNLHQAVALNGQSVAALFLLARVYLATGDIVATLPVFRQLLTLAPDVPEVLNEYGNALLRHGELDAARQQFMAALQRQPDLLPARNNLGLVSLALKDLDTAESCFRQVTGQLPEFAEGWNNLANVLNLAGQHAEALECCERALQQVPDYLQAWATRGNTLKALHRYCEAADAFRRALEIDAMHPGIYNGLGEVLMLTGQIVEALDCYRRSLALYPDDHLLNSALVFTMNYIDLAPELVYQGHCDWARAHAQLAKTVIHPRTGHERPRVGIVSPDLRQHSVAYFLAPVLAAMDAAVIEVYCYSDVEKPDGMTQYLRSLVAHWRDTRALDDAQLWQQVQHDEIDILVDLAGHTRDNRLLLFARRAAPVQVSWLGYPNTTGLACMDYRITDAVADPDGSEQYHTEQLLRLPNGFLCFQGIEKNCELTPLPAARSGHITFGSFNVLPKVTPAVVALWSDILHAVPGSRLLMKNASFRDPLTCELYRRRFAEHGIGAERLDFRGWMTLGEHFALFAEVDIALDTFPYNGTTTTCEALWLGVPVVALAGQAHAGRVSASLLHRVGLDDWVADSTDTYRAIACRYAADFGALAELRAGLRERMRTSSLCDMHGFVEQLEQLFVRLWQQSSSARPDPPQQASCSVQPGAAKTRALQLYRSGRLQEARQLLEPLCQPGSALDDAECWCLLGVICGELDDYEASWRFSSRAIELAPDYAEAWYNLAQACVRLVRFEQAGHAYQKVLALQPDYPDVLANLGFVLLESGQVDQAIACYRRAHALQPADSGVHSSLLFCMNYPEIPAQEVYQAHRDWAALHTPVSAPGAIPAGHPDHERPRVGFISPDFRQHSVAYFLQPALAGLQHRAVDVYCYSDVEQPDSMTQQLRTLAGHWRDCRGLDDAALREQVCADEIDVLVDLAGHSRLNRLGVFARRAAPVQLSWLGYPNTTGLDAMDYRITDALADPEGLTDSFYTEQLLRLPGGFLCYQGVETGSNVAPLPAATRGLITFGSFNKLAKVTPAVVALWSAILQAVPGARLLLKNGSFTEAGNRDRYFRQFAAHGIGPERLDFRGWVGPREHLALYGEIDIALDTFPYNGTTTTCEALWMGVPVIALAGSVHAGRVGVSLLHRVGLQDWVADTPARYLELAVRRAADLQELAAVRAGLRDRMCNSSLCDQSAFAGELEQLFTRLWQQALSVQDS